MTKSDKKQLTIKVNFVNDLVKDKAAFGLYYRMRPGKNTVNIYLDANQNQMEMINTLYHEFTHFVMDLMTNSSNYKRFIKYIPPKENVKQVHEDVLDFEEDLNEEKLCRSIANTGQKRIKKYLTK